MVVHTDRYRPYTKQELQALIVLAERNGGALRYYNSIDIEAEFFALTGKRRASGALYVAYWRMKHGYYARLLSN